MTLPNDDDFYTDKDQESEHVDEKWLISYSDMMTLLFGFFVMMYVLSSSNKAKMEETLQKISKEGFSSETPVTNDQKPITNMRNTKAATDDILIELKKRKEEKEREKKNLEDELIQTKAEFVKNEAELKISLEKVKLVEESKVTLLKEKSELEIKVKELEQLTIEKSQSIDFQNKDVAQLKKMKSNIVDLENNLKTVQEKNNGLLQENLELKKRIEDGPKINEDDHFMMVFVRWETEKHDIDMIVEDPKGHVFNFKKRTLASVPGEFVVDSTQGPGVESWVTNKTIEGIYKVTVKFYNQYGNKKDAIIKASIFNNLKVANLPPITLNFSGRKEQTVSIRVAKDGQFKVLP